MALALFVAILASAAAPQVGPQDIAIIGVNVVDVVRGRSVADRTVVLRGSRILTVGARATVVVPSGARVIEGRGKYLIPGLWDMHGHLFQHSSRPGTDEHASQFPLYVANGVTGVRDMWTNLEDLRRVRRWNADRARGALLAPRILPTGPMFDGDDGILNHVLVVSSANAARRAVDSVVDGGAQAIKIHDALSHEAFLAIAARAKERGVPLIGHVPASVTVREAVRAGQHSIEHLNGIADGCASAKAEGEAARIRTDRAQRASAGTVQQLIVDGYDEHRCVELIRELARRGVWQVPTLIAEQRRLILPDSIVTTRADLRYVSAADRDDWRKQLQAQRERLSPTIERTRRLVFAEDLREVLAMSRAGVPLLAGTDVTNPWQVPGFSLHEELALLVEAGLTPAEALRAATVSAARYANMADSLGTVARGKVADLVLLDADPLLDIGNAASIRAVVLNGRYLGRPTLDSLLERQQSLASPASTPERAVINDNRRAAGTLRDGVLTVRLEARETDWHMEADSSRGVRVRAFAVEGGPPLVPGPLLRVPQGTEIHAFIHNTLIGKRLLLHGLNTRGIDPDDTIAVAAGETREVHFAAARIGTYFYWAATNTAAISRRDGADSQLSGAFIVDPPNTPPPRDRVFVIAGWTGAVLVAGDSVGTFRFTINGTSWPSTERLTYDVGDSVRIRVINTGVAPHPMHLHGFYFNVDSRGSEQADSIYGASSSPHLVNTERLPSGRTFALTWVPTRAGNWLFHCHDPAHIKTPNVGLDGSAPIREADMHGSAMLAMMSGPVIGITVRELPGRTAAVEAEPQRRLRLVAHEESGGARSEPVFAYALDSGTAVTFSRGARAPTIVLQRGVPVAITVVNHLREATSVHWHGIELDSYYDGVAGFSGHEAHLAPEIAPNDSFVARFTPPRSGKFMYHPHGSELRQQQAGLGGALIVVDSLDGYDATTDIAMLVTTPRTAVEDQNDIVYLNGTPRPPPRELHVGTTYRLRLLDLHNNRGAMIMRLVRDSTVLAWTPVAKDGMDLPADQRIVRAAAQQMSAGETYDFAFTPALAGDMWFDIRTGQGKLLLRMPMRVTGRATDRRE
jgi:FtsP/CotA-like multicopper oxidase with cupredoxin domain/imidazolonepropionase-like amidohydrolase